MTASAVVCLWRERSGFLPGFYSRIYHKVASRCLVLKKGIDVEKNIQEEKLLPRGVAVAEECPVSCLTDLLREGNLDQVLTSAQHVPRCVRAFPVSHPPSPRPACQAAAST